MIVVVCAVIVVEQGKVLLIQESKKVAKHKYGLPGGKLEIGETLLECAKREFLEETGMDIEIRDLVEVTHKPSTREGNSVLKYIFTGDLQNRAFQQPELKTIWVGLDELTELGQEGKIRGKDVVWVLSKMFKGELKAQTIPNTFA